MFLLLGTASILANQNANTSAVSYYSGNWEAAKDEARRTGKSIFVKLWADWCVNCKVMDEHVFTDPQVSEFYNENFINYSLNYDSDEGEVFARTHGVQFLPDFFFFDSKANLVLRATDSKSTTQMLDLGYKAVGSKGSPLYNAIEAKGTTYTKKESSPKVYHSSTTNHVGTYRENLNIYEAGYDKKAFLRNFAVQSKQMGKDFEGIAKRYVKKAKWTREDWNSPENQQFLFEFVDAPEAKPMKLVLKNKEALKENYGRYNVEARFKHGIRNYVLDASMRKDKKVLKRSLRLIGKANLLKSGEFKHEARLSFYENAHDWKKYASEINHYTKSFEGLDPVKLNIAAWNIYNNSSKKRLIRKAIKWCKTSMAISPQYYNHETYAHLLHKLGKDKKAKSAVLRALVMANREGKVNTRAEQLAQDIDAKN